MTRPSENSQRLMGAAWHRVPTPAPRIRMIGQTRIASLTSSRPPSVVGLGWDSKQFARVHPSVRVECGLDRMHQRQFHGGLVAACCTALKLPEPVLGADRAAALVYRFVHDFVKGLLVFE